MKTIKVQHQEKGNIFLKAIHVTMKEERYEQRKAIDQIIKILFETSYCTISGKMKSGWRMLGKKK